MSSCHISLCDLLVNLASHCVSQVEPRENEAHNIYTLSKEKNNGRTISSSHVYTKSIHTTYLAYSALIKTTIIYRHFYSACIKTYNDTNCE